MNKLELIKQLAEEVEKGDLKQLRPLNTMLHEERLYSPKLLENLVEKGEPNYLRTNHYDKNGKEILYLKSSEEQNYITMAQFVMHYAKVLGTDAKFYHELSKDRVIYDLSEAIIDDKPFVAVFSDDTLSAIACDGEKLLFYSDIERQEPTGSIQNKQSYMFVLADLFNLAQFKGMISQTSKVLGRFGKEKMWERPIIPYEEPFGTFIENADFLNPRY